MIWVTYSKFAGDSTAKESPFYGSTWSSITCLRRDHPLDIVFLVVSRFGIREKKDESAWKFNFDHGNNREILPEYRGIEPLFEY